MLGRLGDEPIKEVVLCDLEAGDLFDDFGPMAQHGIGVTLGLAMFLRGQRCLGHHGTDAGVVRFVGEMSQLLIGDDQLLTGLTQSRAELGESAFDGGPGHGGSLERPEHPVAQRAEGVPGAGFEPARPEGLRILSAPRLPVPPSGPGGGPLSVSRGHVPPSDFAR